MYGRFRDVLADEVLPAVPTARLRLADGPWRLGSKRPVLPDPAGLPDVGHAGRHAVPGRDGVVVCLVQVVSMMTAGGGLMLRLC